MSRPQQPPDPDRRRFIKSLGLATVSSALAPPIVLMAQTPPGPIPGAAPTKPDSASAPSAPTEISEDARTLVEIVRRRYGKHLTADQLEAVAREIDGRLKGGQRMREVKLANGDEPDFTFHA